MRIFRVVILLLAALPAASTTADPVELTSPAGDLVVSFTVKDFPDAAGCPCYRVRYKGRCLIASRVSASISKAVLRITQESSEYKSNR